MALSDCKYCWETPCICGQSYEDWSYEKREELAKAITYGASNEDIKKLVESINKEINND